MRHQTMAAPAGAMLQAAGCGQRWSVRRLAAFDAPEALALATGDEVRRLHRLQLLTVQAHLEVVRGGRRWRVRALPLLVLDDNAEPAMLWPLLHWLAPSSSPALAVRGVVTLACEAQAHDIPSQPLLPGLRQLAVTTLQGRALMRALLAALPAPAELFVCHAVMPTAASPFDGATPPARVLPGCRRLHARGWRGFLAALRLLPTMHA